MVNPNMVTQGTKMIGLHYFRVPYQQVVLHSVPVAQLHRNKVFRHRLYFSKTIVPWGKDITNNSYVFQDFWHVSNKLV